MFEDFTYEQRLAFIEAVANIVAADGKVTAEERAELESLTIGVGLWSSDPDVKAAIERQIAKPGSLSEILTRLGSKELHAAVFRLLIEAACADGEIQAEERAKLLEAATLFGYDKQAAGELVDWTLESIKHERREQDILARLA